MSFEAPAALWGLASLALLAIFSLWRQAAERVTVPSLRLWKMIPERNPPIRALRRPQVRWELLLQAVAVAALVLALAGPFVASDRARPRRVALVLDTSARLRAGGRFERLREDAARLARERLSGDEVSIYAADPTPRRLPPSELGSVRPVDEHVDLEPLLAAARREAEQVVVFSDRAPSGVRARLREGPAANAGIVGFSVAQDEVFARIVNHGPPRRVPLVLRIDDRRIEAAADLPAGGERAWHHKADLAGALEVFLELLAEDGFPLDDVAGATRLAPAAATATVSGRRDEAVLRALGSVPGVALRDGGEALVAVGVDAEPGPGTIRVRLHPPADPAPAPVTVVRHPLTAGLEGRESEFGRVGELPPAQRSGEALLRAGERTVAARRGADVHLSVDLDPRRGWPAFPSFPIFWTNVVDFARKGEGAWAVARTGRPFPLPAGVTGVTPPDAGALWSGSGGGEFLAHTAGEYVVRRPEGDRRLRVAVLDGRESDARGTSRELDWDPAAPEGRQAVPSRLGGWAAAAALGALLLAWLLQRRGA